MGNPKALLRLPAPSSMLKPATLPRRLPTQISSAGRQLHHPSRLSSTPLSALRQLARRLFSTTKPAVRTPTPPAPADLASRVRLHTRPSFHPAAQQARQFGPGGLGRGPMGPGLRSGFAAGKSVASVGLGQARGYASTAQPLFNNLVVNAPLLLRAGVDELKDQAMDLKKQRRARPAHAKLDGHGKKRSSSSKASSSLFQSSTVTRGPSNVASSSTPITKAKAVSSAATAVPAEEADFHAFFGPSPSHAIPAARSPWTTTTLVLPLAPDLRASVAPAATSLSHLASLHREAYDQHRFRLDNLLHGLERRGAWLDDDVRVEAGEDEVRVVFTGRATNEVRTILGSQSADADWFTVHETRKGSPSVAESSASLATSSFVFPLLSASVTFPAACAAPVCPSRAFSTTPSLSGVTTPGSAASTTTCGDDGDGDSLSSSAASFSSGFLSDLSVSSAGQQGFSVIDVSAEEGFDEDWSDA